jgi:hypothetical protein
MNTTKTLTLKKPENPAQTAQKQRPERSLIGKEVVIQTKSPSRITGRISSFEGGWIVIVGTEHRWLSDGTLSGPITTGEFMIDRSNVTYFLAVM